MRHIDYDILASHPCPICGGRRQEEVTRRKDGGRIVRCDDCAHCHLNPTIPPGVLKEIYEDEYFVTGDDDAWLRLVEEWFSDPRGPYQRALAIIDSALPPGSAVCEIGCGTGRFLDELKRKGHAVRGIEPSPKAIELARSRFALELQQGYLAEPLPEGFRGAFAAACSFEVIEHVYEPLEFLRLCGSLLQPGGLLILSTPNFALFESLGDSYTEMNTQEHIQFFTRPTLAMALERAGFDVVETSTGQERPLGERLHMRWAPAVYGSWIWQRLRRSVTVQAAKARLVRALGQVRTPLDQSGESGAYVFALARKR